MIQLQVDKILEKRRLTKYWLATRMGLSYKNFDNMIKNKTKAIRYENIEKLCRILECSPNDLFEFVPPLPQKKDSSDDC